ncbi:MAG: VapC toxin family PIN domain ribonuclease [Thermoprotei archaeon]|nr:MAG: VapC toxin family PIN domain ribonuclease [Thermoprotei archaeon]
MKLLLDTNVLVYNTIEDSGYHDLAVKIIDDAKGIYIPSIIVHEYMWVMLKLANAPPSFIVLKLREYLEDPRTTYILESINILTDALKMLEEDHASLREINDYIILATAINYNIAIVAFDEKLKKIAIKRNLETIP